MNIVYDYQAFSMQRYGGISRYFYELISRLCKEDEFAVYLFLGLYINEYGLSDYRDDYARLCGVKHRHIPRTVRVFDILNKLLFAPFLRTSYANIYHQTHYDGVSVAFPGKRVLTVHDMIHEFYPNLFTKRDRTSKNKKISIKRADAIICVSESTKNDLIRLCGVPKDRIRVIYHGNSLTPARQARSLLGKPYILYVGHRGAHKNFPLLREAYAAMRNINSTYSLVCFGGEPFSREERAILRSEGLEKKVLSISGNDQLLANLYQHAAVFVYPSLYEGFGIPPLEAMSCGCAVLASNTSSIPEVVGDAGVYFDPTSRDDLTFQLNRILGDDSFRSKLIARGYEQGKKFSWDRCANETMLLYQQV